MDEQYELFEIKHEDWVSRLWKSAPATSRQEVIDLLAEMGRAALQARRTNPVTQRKGTSDEP
jgi:hypothetical protein